MAQTLGGVQRGVFPPQSSVGRYRTMGTGVHPCRQVFFLGSAGVFLFHFCINRLDCEKLSPQNVIAVLLINSKLIYLLFKLGVSGINAIICLILVKSFSRFKL